MTLTVDETIQYFAEKVAEEGKKEYKADGVSIIVMNPKNGEILAMANKPDYNPNEPYKGYEKFPVKIKLKRWKICGKMMPYQIHLSQDLYLKW